MVLISTIGDITSFFVKCKITTRYRHEFRKLVGFWAHALIFQCIDSSSNIKLQAGANMKVIQKSIGLDPKGYKSTSATTDGHPSTSRVGSQ
jgi:hypothetical protein